MITIMVVSSTPVAPVSSQGVTPLSRAGNAFFNPAVTRPLFGFSMPMINRDYPYGMPTSVMVGIHTNMSNFSDNVMVNVPSYKTHRRRPSIIWFDQEG